MTPIAILIVILRPIIRIRVGHVWAERIGHLALQAEEYLAERELNPPPRNTIDVFWLKAAPGRIANPFLIQLIRRKITIAWWTRYLESSLKRLPGGSRHLIAIQSRDKYGDRDVEKILLRTPPHLEFSQEEEQRGQRELESLGLPPGARYVVLYGRDPAYLDSWRPDLDTNYHNYRDMDINSLQPTANWLGDRGIYSIRIGSHVKAPLASDHPLFVDYATSDLRSPFLDVYLCARCCLFLGVPGGMETLSRIFRRPHLYINSIPLEYILAWDPCSMTLPKIMMDSQTHEYIPFQKINQSGIGRFLKTEEYESGNVTVIDNTAEDILAAAQEMILRLEDQWKVTPRQRELTDRFWSCFLPSQLNQKFDAQIPLAFLEKYEALLP